MAAACLLTDCRHQRVQRGGASRAARVAYAFPLHGTLTWSQVRAALSPDPRVCFCGLLRPMRCGCGATFVHATEYITHGPVLIHIN